MGKGAGGNKLTWPDRLMDTWRWQCNIYVQFVIFFYRGLTGNTGRVAFRQWYSCIHELWSLIPSELPFMALTATASEKTKKDIFHALELNPPFEVVESPDGENIVYAMQLIEKGETFSTMLDGWRTGKKRTHWKGFDILSKCQTMHYTLPVVCKCTFRINVFWSLKRPKKMAGWDATLKDTVLSQGHYTRFIFKKGWPHQSSCSNHCFWNGGTSINAGLSKNF